MSLQLRAQLAKNNVESEKEQGKTGQNKKEKKETKEKRRKSFSGFSISFTILSCLLLVYLNIHYSIGIVKYIWKGKEMGRKGRSSPKGKLIKNEK